MTEENYHCKPDSELKGIKPEVDKCIQGLEKLIWDAADKRENVVRVQNDKLNKIDQFLLDLRANIPYLTAEVDKMRKIINEPVD